MHTLESLQEMGVLLSSIKTVKCENALTISDLLEMDEEHQASFKGVVTVDNPIWVATVSAMPIEEAKNVYSSDGNIVGKWSRGEKEQTFYKMKLQGNSLATFNIHTFKEEKRMAEMTPVNEQELLKQLEEAQGSLTPAGETKAATAFPEDTTKDRGEQTEKQRKKEADRQHYEGIREKLNAGFNGEVLAPVEVTRNNWLFGRSYGFITGTNSCVKFGLSKKAKVGKDGKKMLNPEVTDPAIIEKYNKGETVARENYVQESCFTIKEAKPAAAKAMIIATPAGTDLALTTIGNESAKHYDLENKDLVFHLMDISTAYVYLAYNYGDRIQEAAEVLGAKADVLDVVHSFTKDKNGQDKSKTVFKPRNRKSAVIEGNYIPLKVYDTVSLQDPTPENKAAMNYNIEAIISKGSKNLEILSDEAKAQYRIKEDGSIESVWINDGAPISVTHYDNPEEVITNVCLPKREKELKKDGSGYRYKFSYLDFNSENGPLSMPEYTSIIKACGWSSEQFAKLVETTLHKGRKSNGSGKSVNRTISYEQYLRGIAAGDELVVNESKSFKELQDVLDSVMTI